MLSFSSSTPWRFSAKAVSSHGVRAQAQVSSHTTDGLTNRRVLVGWSSVSQPTVAAGFSQPYATAYDQAGYAAQQDMGVKARLINLISAVRTLMRSACAISLTPFVECYADMNHASTLNRSEPHHHWIRTGIRLLNIYMERLRRSAQTSGSSGCQSNHWFM